MNYDTNKITKGEENMATLERSTKMKLPHWQGESLSSSVVHGKVQKGNPSDEMKDYFRIIIHAEIKRESSISKPPPSI